MGFLELDRLPDYLEPGSGGGPRFKTPVKVYFDGSEKRIALWRDPRQQFDVRFGFHFLRGDHVFALQSVIDQFNVAQGKTNGFRYRDRLDDSIPSVITADENQQIALGDDSTTTFQIIKSYIRNSDQYDRVIEKIVEDTDRVWIESTELARTSGTPGPGQYAIDITTGQITTGDVPASTGGTGPGGEQIVFVQCQFDNAVRFERIDLRLRLDTIHTDAESGSIPSLPLVSLKPTAWAGGPIGNGFLELDRLPGYIGSITGGSKFLTTVKILDSGHEQRYPDWLDVRGEWTVTFSTHPLDGGINPIRELLDLFYVAMGKWRGFRFEDPADHHLEAEQIGTGNGSQTQFQAIKTYQTASGSLVKQIVKPQGQFQALVDDLPVGSTTDTATGLVTLDAAAPNGLSVKITGGFDKPVRFDDDAIRWSISVSSVDGTSAAVGRLSLVELKP